MVEKVVYVHVGVRQHGVNKKERRVTPFVPPAVHGPGVFIKEWNAIQTDGSFILDHESLEKAEQGLAVQRIRANRRLPKTGQLLGLAEAYPQPAGALTQCLPTAHSLMQLVADYILAALAFFHLQKLENAQDRAGK